MKKNEKKTGKTAEPKTKPETAHKQKASAVSPAARLPIAERARQRAAASRQAAVNKVVTQSPD